MIKQVSLKENKESTLIVLGKGDVLTTDSYSFNGECRELLFKQYSPAVKEERCVPESYLPDVIIRFETKQSFEDFYNHISDIKKRM